MDDILIGKRDTIMRNTAIKHVIGTHDAKIFP